MIQNTCYPSSHFERLLIYHFAYYLYRIQICVHICQQLHEDLTDCFNLEPNLVVFVSETKIIKIVYIV